MKSRTLRQLCAILATTLTAILTSLWGSASAYAALTNSAGPRPTAGF